MKPYKVLALLKKVPSLKAGDQRVIVNGEPFKIDYRVVADDLFRDGLSAFEEALSDIQATKKKIEEVTKELEKSLISERFLKKEKAELYNKYEEVKSERDELKEENERLKAQVHNLKMKLKEDPCATCDKNWLNS